MELLTPLSTVFLRKARHSLLSRTGWSKKTLWLRSLIRPRRLRLAGWPWRIRISFLRLAWDRRSRTQQQPFPSRNWADLAAGGQL